MKKKGLIGGVAAAVLIVVALVTVLFCTERIPAGYVGVVYNMNGGVDGEVLTQGWHVVAPTKKVTTYSIGIEQSYLTAADKGDSPNDDSFSMGPDHTHYQLDKIGLSLGVLCIDKGVASFAPLNTMDKVTNAEFINIQSFPLFDDLIDLFAIFRKMFVETEE